MPKHRQPYNVDPERSARIKHHVNLAFEATNLSKKDFTKLCFPNSRDMTTDSKNVFNWLRTGQISKPMLIPFARASGVSVEFLLGEKE